MATKSKEPRYQLNLTYDQLRILKSQMEAAAEPAHRCAVEDSLLDVIYHVHQRALASRKAKVECGHDYSEPRREPVAATGHESPSRQMETVVLETKDSRGKELWISRDEYGLPVLFCLDCNFHSMGGRDFDELPRCYRTERGARQAAARLTGDKLIWKAPKSVAQS